MISITLSSLQRSDPPRPLQNTWTREGLNPQKGGGGGPSCEWFTSARNLRCDRSLPLPQDCPQYIPKGKPTPASKLAFVISMSNIIIWVYPKMWYTDRFIMFNGEKDDEPVDSDGSPKIPDPYGMGWISMGVPNKKQDKIKITVR